MIRWFAFTSAKLAAQIIFLQMLAKHDRAQFGNFFKKKEAINEPLNVLRECRCFIASRILVQSLDQGLTGRFYMFSIWQILYVVNV